MLSSQKLKRKSLLTKSRQKKPLLLWQGIRRHPIRSLPSQPARRALLTLIWRPKAGATCGQKGISIKVETNGQSGIKHALTAEEIEGAEGIIVAADKYVPMNRFKGKRVVIVKVADGINKADALLDEAFGEGPHF